RCCSGRRGGCRTGASDWRARQSISAYAPPRTAAAAKFGALRSSLHPAPAARGEVKNGARRTWRLRLYVAGHTPKSIAALANLMRLCDSHLAGRYSIEVVDLLDKPHLARRDDIVVV